MTQSGEEVTVTATTASLYGAEPRTVVIKSTFVDDGVTGLKFTKAPVKIGPNSVCLYVERSVSVVAFYLLSG